MASFERRGKSVRAVISVPGGLKVSKTFKTLTEARQWAAKEERTKATVKGDQIAKRTVGALLDLYLDLVVSKKDSARWDTLRILKWLREPIADYAVNSVTPHHINLWIAQRSSQTVKRRGSVRNISGATVNRELNLWSSAFAYAVGSLKWIESNPCCAAARPPSGPGRNRALLTRSELAAICAAGGYSHYADLSESTPRVVACFLLALETGMRSGEILRIRPPDFDQARRSLNVAASERGGRKTSRSGRRPAPRLVPLTEFATELCCRLVLSSPQGQRPTADLPSPPYIVGISDSSRDAIWRKIRDRSGVKDLTFHDTKHEACTRLASLIDVLALSHAIGTKDLALLRDTYYANEVARTVAQLPNRISDGP